MFRPAQLHKSLHGLVIHKLNLEKEEWLSKWHIFIICGSDQRWQQWRGETVPDHSVDILKLNRRPVGQAHIFAENETYPQIYIFLCTHKVMNYGII